MRRKYCGQTFLHDEEMPYERYRVESVIDEVWAFALKEEDRTMDWAHWHVEIDARSSLTADDILTILGDGRGVLTVFEAGGDRFRFELFVGMP